MSESGWSEADLKVFNDISEVGWHVMLVAEDPPFAYTIGLWGRFKTPEMVVIGFPFDVAHPLCNIYGVAARDGKPIGPGECDAFFEDRRGYLLKVSLAHYEEFGFCRWIYQDHPFDVLQLVSADENNILPWEEGFAERLRDKWPLWGDVPG